MYLNASGKSKEEDSTQDWTLTWDVFKLEGGTIWSEPTTYWTLTWDVFK